MLSLVEHLITQSTSLNECEFEKKTQTLNSDQRIDFYVFQNFSKDMLCLQVLL